MYDFVSLGFELAFRYRNPCMILSDGVIGQMMEKVEIGDQKKRWSEAYIREHHPWSTLGKTPDRPHNIITSLELESSRQEKVNLKIQAKYRILEAEEVRYEMIDCEDADYIFVAYGSSARICQKAMELGREKGIKIGLLRPITLYPFPVKILHDLAGKVKGMLVVEMSAGQMIEDVKLAVECRVHVEHYGRFGGIIPSPAEVLHALENQIIGG
jgi:2-oxoglutarate ferredoxin oxidoreductase subunit alpha